MKTVKELVREAISDGEEHTAKQIAKAIFPDAPEWELRDRINKTFTALRSMEKWGEVERVGFTRDGIRGGLQVVWRRV